MSIMMLHAGKVPSLAHSFLTIDNSNCKRTVSIWESSQWLGKNIVWNTGKKEFQESTDRCTGHHDATEIMLKHETINQSTCLLFTKRRNFRPVQIQSICR